MNEEEKNSSHDMANKGKFMYGCDMPYDDESDDEEFKNAEIRRRMKPKKDPNAPKRPLSAFFYFTEGEREKMLAMNPTNIVSVRALLFGKMWLDADITVKQKYEVIAEKDKARYDREMVEYENKKKADLVTITTT